MLPFNEFHAYKSIVKEQIKILLEANIDQSRHAEGSLVVLKTDMIGKFNNKVLGFTADNHTIFKKVPLKIEGESVQIIGPENDTPLVTLDVFEGANGSGTPSNYITTITWTQNPGSYYNHLQEGEGINWGKSTSTLETAQCIGVFPEARELYDLVIDKTNWPKNRQTGIDLVTKVLSKGEDWHNKGASNLLEKLPDLPDTDWITLANLIRGMAIFCDAIIPFKTKHIIHGSIDSGYKKQEAENPFNKVIGIKDNTSDMIICNSSADKLTTAIGTEKVTADGNGVCTTSGGIQFVQVSLKKAKEGAQLGKVTDMIVRKYDMPSYLSIYREVVKEQFHPDYIQLLDEGFFDFIKKGWESIKSASKAIAQGFIKLVTAAAAFAKGWISDMKSVFNKETNNSVNEFSKRFGVNARDMKSLTESYIFGQSQLLIEKKNKKDSINEVLKNAKASDIDSFVTSINGKILDLIKLYDQHDHLDHIQRGGGLNRKKITTSFNVDTSIKLLANEVSLRTLDKIFRQNAGKMQKLVNQMIDIQKEIFFGKTSLPLYKVYGAEGEGKPYEFLQTAKEFSAKKGAQIGTNNPLQYPVHGFSVSSQKGMYYNIESWILTGVKNGEATYAKMRMGTNQAGQFSYIVEGTQERTQTQYNKTFGKK
jgi:hypothetical protein|tara:strand:+ start:45 stop:1991 length:1947 start_codon:yes stop_codon:yes gene_type:complete